MNEGYDVFPAAIAESRAEVRALKKILHLRNLPAYEEVSKQGDVGTPIFDESVDNRTDKITATQKAMIMTKCQQFGIDVTKYINKKHWTNPEENPTCDYDSIDDVPHKKASSMVKELNNYQNCTEDSKDIPQSILLD